MIAKDIWIHPAMFWAIINVNISVVFYSWKLFSYFYLSAEIFSLLRKPFDFLTKIDLLLKVTLNFAQRSFKFLKKETCLREFLRLDRNDAREKYLLDICVPQELHLHLLDSLILAISSLIESLLKFVLVGLVYVVFVWWLALELHPVLQL